MSSTTKTGVNFFIAAPILVAVKEENPDPDVSPSLVAAIHRLFSQADDRLCI